MLEVELEDVGAARHIEGRLRLAVHEAQVASQLRLDLAWAEDLDCEDLEARAEQAVQRRPDVAEGQEVRQDHHHAAADVAREERLDSVLERQLAAALGPLDEGEQAGHARASRARAQPLDAAFAEGRDADPLGAQQAHDAEGGGELLGPQELVLEEHGLRGVEDDGHVHLLFLLEELDVRAIQAREGIPVHEPHVVARRVVAEVGELGARAPAPDEVLAAAPVGEAPRRIDAEQLEAAKRPVVEQRRHLGLAGGFFHGLALFGHGGDDLADEVGHVDVLGLAVVVEQDAVL